MSMSEEAGPMFGQTGGQHRLAGLIDHSETYGRHVIEQMIRRIASPAIAVDIGAGGGGDLAIVKRVSPSTRTVAIEAGREYALALEGKVDAVEILNIERDAFPFAAESVNLFIANQVLEHTKEVFWIFDQVFRGLTVGGHFLVGVPNIASLHNRLLMLFGIQPTQHKLCSAHVRPFSRRDTMRFLSECFPGCSVEAFAGSQFYPFPRPIARLLARIFPTMAFSIFFLIRKDATYNGEFAAYPARARLETNFWCGPEGYAGQYR
jgi:hypothetical protein